MKALLLLAMVAAAALPASGSASPQRGFAFGRTGGNIVPFSVSIANDGTVRSTGPVMLRRKKLTRLQIASLNRVATTSRFTTMPAVTNCPGTLPDIAATFVRVGVHRVLVHGGCMPAYHRVYDALARAVKLSP